MDATGAFGVEATIIDAPVLGELRIRERALVVVDGHGTIRQVLGPDAPGYEDARQSLADRDVLYRFGDGQYLLPGLVDLHNHAPQWPHLGKALDVPLEVWLNQYTFPLEAKYENVDFAATVYESLVTSMIANGTTTAMYFATTHVPATQILVDTCLRHGQRALIGKVAMDHPDGCPDYYRDASARTGIDDTVRLIEYVQGHRENQTTLVHPVVTPRFIPSCTDEMLSGLGDLVAATSAHVQTHCSESDWAHQYGIERYGRTDVATYYDFGLLTPKTVLAHANFITPNDMDTIVSVGAAVAHCPLSNVFFANAVFPTRQALDAGMHIGLGTDISGGPSPSMFNAAGDAVASSRAREDGVDATLTPDLRGVTGSRLTFAEALWMATTGGGIALNLPIGLVDPGYAFDAIIIDPTVADSDLMFWPELDSPNDMLQKIVHNATRRNVTQVWIQGREVKSV